jgi:tmRNA-binding protein
MVWKKFEWETHNSMMSMRPLLFFFIKCKFKILVMECKNKKKHKNKKQNVKQSD